MAKGFFDTYFISFTSLTQSYEISKIRLVIKISVLLAYGLSTETIFKTFLMNYVVSDVGIRTSV